MGPFRVRQQVDQGAAGGQGGRRKPRAERRREKEGERDKNPAVANGRKALNPGEREDRSDNVAVQFLFTARAQRRARSCSCSSSTTHPLLATCASNDSSDSNLASNQKHRATRHHHPPRSPAPPSLPPSFSFFLRLSSSIDLKKRKLKY